MEKIFLILFILLSISIVSNHALSYTTDRFTIKDIHIEGLQRVPIREILSNLPFHIKDTVSNNDIAHAIKILFNTEYFENIKILKKKNILIIQLKEHPLIAHINITGNQTIKKDILNNNLKLQGIQEGKLCNPHNILKIEEILKGFYCDIGKYNTKIQTTITHISNNRINLKIKFNEGKATNLKKINIIGNHKFSLSKLLKLFQLNHTVYGSSILFKKKYQKKIFLHDLESLRNFYLNKGFAKFKINSIQTRLTPDKKNIYISIYITEGLQYKISKVLINGNLSNFAPEIHSLLKIYPNELYNNQKIEHITEKIKHILGIHGYIKPNIITDIETNDINKTIKLYINIDIGKCFYINTIKFIGNTSTKDIVLRREIPQMENTWINSNLIQQGQEQLNRTGYFDSVKVYTENLPTISDQVNVIYQVKERNSGNININVGIGSESGINFQCGIQQENLFGTGNSFILNSTKNNYQNYTELSVNYPYLTINNINLGEKIFYNHFSANHADLADYGLKSYGMHSNIGFPINAYNSLNFGLDYIHNHLSDIKPQIAIWRYLNSQRINPKIIINNKIKNTKKTFYDINLCNDDLFFRIDWKRNTLNHAYFPTYGSYSNCSGKITIPGSDNKYYKLTVNTTYYIPLYQESNYWILMGSIHTGYTGGLYGKENPFYDNFYSGGVNIVRGFRNNTIGPKAAYYTYDINDATHTTYTIKNSQDAIGGNAITILKGELIIPPPFLKKYTNTIRTSIFIDAGTVWDTYWKNTAATYIAAIPNYKKANNIRVSNGLAIQWMSPIGPVAFSYAKLIKKYPEDKIEQFQFNIGKTW